MDAHALIPRFFIILFEYTKEVVSCMRRVLLVLLCLSFSCGCTVAKTGKKMYQEYVNPRPQVDLTIQAEEESAPPDFASLFVPVDTRLNALERDLSIQDTYPPDAWFDGFMQRYPWLGSLAAVNAKGEVLFQKQAANPGNIPYASLCAGDWKTRDPRAAVVGDESGKRICLTMPFFKNNIWKGCLVASFLPKDLVVYSPRSESLVLLSAEKEVLWAGKYAERIDTLADQPWTDFLTEQVSGEITAYGQQFFWLGRTFSGTWLIYASQIP